MNPMNKEKKIYCLPGKLKEQQIQLKYFKIQVEIIRRKICCKILQDITSRQTYKVTTDKIKSKEEKQ